MRIRAQFAVQLVGGIANALVYLVLTPVLIRHLGLERYGVLALVLGFAIYVNLADLGIGAATSRELAAAGSEKRRPIYGSSLLLASFFGTVAGALFASLALPGVGQLVGVGVAVSAELRSAAPALFLLGLTSILAGVPQGAQFGLSRFAQMNFVSIVGTSASVLGPAAYAVFVGKDISGLVYSVAFSRILAGMLAHIDCRRAGLRPEFSVSLAVVRKLLSYGGWSTIIGILHRATNSADRIVIGMMRGAAVLPFFVVPQGALSRSQMVGTALMSAVFPRLARQSNQHGLEKACYRAILLLTPVFVAGVLVTPFLLSVWMGVEFSRRATVVAVLLGGWAWLETLGTVPYVIIQANATMQREATISAAICAPNILLLIAAIHWWGPTGAAVVAVLRSTAYFLARAAATSGKSIPWGEIVASGLLVAGATIAATVLTDSLASYTGGLVLISSLIVSFANRPTFIDEIVMGAVRPFWSVRPAEGRSLPASLDDDRSTRSENLN